MESYSLHKLTIATYVFLALLHITIAQDPNDPHVTTKIGVVYGTQMQVKDVNVHCYLGVPYAEPPIGPLRFKPTEKIYRNLHKIHAKKPRSCIQHTNIDFPWYDRDAEKDEDCLYTNIWCPQHQHGDISKPKAVLVWIHGGGFYTGSNRVPLYHGELLAAAGGIIVVTVNYRLGVFGFAHSQTEHAPGNMGILDILMALEWINDNIEAFGGDKNRITLGGHDAGAVIATMLETSPKASGLYTQLFIQSGSATGKLIEQETNMELTQKLAESMFCVGHHEEDPMTVENNPQFVMDCLSKQDADRLSTDAYTLKPSSMFNFMPRHGDDIIPNNPREEIIKGNIRSPNILVGITQDEGSMFLPIGYTETFGPYGYHHVDLDKETASGYIRDLYAGHPNPDDVVDHYMRGIDDTDHHEIRRQCHKAMGDMVFACPTTYFAETASKHGSNVFFYYYAHSTSKVSPWADWMGAAHGNELECLFGNPYRDDVEDPYTEEERLMCFRMMDDFSAFVKTGKPRRPWMPYSRENPHLVVFNSSGDYHAKGPHRPNCDMLRDHMGF